MRIRYVLLGLLVAAPAAAQDHLLCNTTAVGPFIVKSGAPFEIAWIMADSVLEGGVSVPQRIDGFYLQVDNGPKEDIGKAKALTPCSAGSQKPGDIPYIYTTAKGVSRGNHNIHLSAWNYALDGNGNPTTNRQESPATVVPFSGGELLQEGAPANPVNVAIGQ